MASAEQVAGEIYIGERRSPTEGRDERNQRMIPLMPWETDYFSLSTVKVGELMAGAT